MWLSSFRLILLTLACAVAQQVCSIGTRSACCSYQGLTRCVDIAGYYSGLSTYDFSFSVPRSLISSRIATRSLGSSIRLSSATTRAATRSLGNNIPRSAITTRATATGLPGYSIPRSSSTRRTTSTVSTTRRMTSTTKTTSTVSSNNVVVEVCNAGVDAGGCWVYNSGGSSMGGPGSYITTTRTLGGGSLGTAAQDNDDDASATRATRSAPYVGASAARSSVAVDSNRAAVISVCGGVLAMLDCAANLL